MRPAGESPGPSSQASEQFGLAVRGFCPRHDRSRANGLALGDLPLAEEWRVTNDSQIIPEAITSAARRSPFAPSIIPKMAAPAASPGQPAAGGSGRFVLVLNSGSSSVKFALLAPGTGERLMAGIGERLGTPAAALRVQQFPAAAVEERLPGGSHRAVVTRVLDRLAAGHPGVHLLGAGHRVVHGGELFTTSIRAGCRGFRVPALQGDRRASHPIARPMAIPPGAAVWPAPVPGSAQ